MLRSEKLGEILRELKKVGGIEASAVVSRDGILMASDIPDDVHGETFAIMSATMLGAAITANSELRKKLPERIIVESGDGRTVVAGAGEKSLLVVSTSGNADMAAVLKGITGACSRVEDIE
jgi:predicted regulator of Ras-like GTPase activity (Roadblock/LC7/MglB family)